MKISLSGVTGDSIVDGPGIRLTIFTQGCPHNCPGCHNPQTHDPNGGSWGDTEDILAAAAENPLLDGITLSGGDPFMQPVPCLENDPEKIALLKESDVLIDGPFLLAERSLELKFKGSRNQRTIDVKKSLEAGEVVLWEEPNYFEY